MTTVNVADALRQLGFCTPMASINALLVELSKSRSSPAQSIERLVRVERTERDQRNLARRSRSAALGSFKTADKFDWSWPRAIDRARYEQLTSLAFVGQAHNVLFRGQPGTGKTMLALNLGLLALQQGYSVRFSTLSAALADLLRQESSPALERRFKRYTMPDLLILDELGYLPQDTRAADLLYNIIARRHERASTVITTNLAYKQWGAIFPSAACVGALVDRFAQHCFTIDIDADTFRGKPQIVESKPPPTKRKR